jgi:hypothetical protein
MSNVVSFRREQFEKLYQEIESDFYDFKKDTVYRKKKDLNRDMTKAYIKLLSDFKY